MLLPKPDVTGLTFYRGRVAMYALLKALGVGPGDEVALQAFTCLAVPEGVMALGAKPLYVDIEPDGFNMAAEDLERKLTESTRAIVVQHTFGVPARMDRLLAVARAHGLPLIEDCCHTLETRYCGQRVGSFGAGAFYSFEWGKPIVTGIGGAAVVNDPAVRERVRRDYGTYLEPDSRSQLRLHAQYLAHRVLYRPVLFWPVRSLYHWLGSLGAAEGNYNPVSKGSVAKDFSLRMAAPMRHRLVKKLARLDRATAHAREVTQRYWDGIRNPAIRPPQLEADNEVAFARYPLRVANKAAVLTAARKANVELAEWYATPVHPLSPEDWPLVHYRAGSCPQVEERCGEIVTLPTHPAVTGTDVERAVRFLQSIAEH